MSYVLILLMAIGVVVEVVLWGASTSPFIAKWARLLLALIKRRFHALTYRVNV
jgi:hypothetical protein